MSDELTEEQTFGAIANALKAGDIEAVGDFLRYAAPRWPHRTEQTMQAMKVALRLRGGTDD